jgi:hypothetical protein
MWERLSASISRLESRSHRKIALSLEAYYPALRRHRGDEGDRPVSFVSPFDKGGRGISESISS